MKYSNYVSVEKFIFYSILSFGIYDLFWIYRNWKLIKEVKKPKIMPFWRTFWTFIWLYDLLKDILILSREKGYKKSYSPGWIFFYYFIINAIGFYSDNDYIWLLSLLGVLFLIPSIKASNYYWKKLDLPEREFKWYHFILVVFGYFYWFLIILGLMI